MDIPDILGITGTLTILIMYFLLQIKKLNAEEFYYSFGNLIGAILLLISLCYHFNLASFIMELCWISISLYGLYKYFKKKKNT